MKGMKRLFILLVALGVAASTITLQQVAAQEGQPMTDAHVERIQANCNDAQTTLQQLHASDGPLRVNRGQAYDSISTKLMTRLNSRLALNKLDGSALVKITSQYDKALSSFRSDYKLYDNQMGATLAIDCRKQPVAFYDSVAKARKLREAVHNDVTEMHRLIGEYQKAFDAFSQQYKTNVDHKGDK